MQISGEVVGSAPGDRCMRKAVRMIKAMRAAIWAAWCEYAHPAPRWPINHGAECPRCLRRRPVEW